MEQFQVIVIGAGPAGLSAALYFAKSKMSTLIIDEGRTLMNSALLDNTYLGLTEPTLGEDFMNLAIAQVKSTGVQFVQAKVLAIRETEDLYSVETDSGSFVATYILLASGIQFDTPELVGIELAENDEPFIRKRIMTDECGRTGQRHIYAAGIATGIASQAIVAAGHGAQIAINLLSDIAQERICVHDKKPRPLSAS